jgi:hypothetical protein
LIYTLSTIHVHICSLANTVDLFSKILLRQCLKWILGVGVGVGVANAPVEQLVALAVRILDETLGSG